jgi:hypothetical protein
MPAKSLADLFARFQQEVEEYVESEVSRRATVPTAQVGTAKHRPSSVYPPQLYDANGQPQERPANEYGIPNYLDELNKMLAEERAHQVEAPSDKGPLFPNQVTTSTGTPAMVAPTSFAQDLVSRLREKRNLQIKN